VPATHAAKRLLLKVTEQNELIVVSAQGVVLARHLVVAGHHQRIVLPEHYSSLISDN